MSGGVGTDTPLADRGCDWAVRVAALAAALCPALSSLLGSLVAILLAATRWGGEGPTAPQRPLMPHPWPITEPFGEPGGPARSASNAIPGGSSDSAMRSSPSLSLCSSWRSACQRICVISPTASSHCGRHTWPTSSPSCRSGRYGQHHVMSHHIRTADRAVLFLNTVLLIGIAFLPFPAAVLYRSAAGERGVGPRVTLLVSNGSSG